MKELLAVIEKLERKKLEINDALNALYKVNQELNLTEQKSMEVAQIQSLPSTSRKTRFKNLTVSGNEQKIQKTLFPLSKKTEQAVNVTNQCARTGCPRKISNKYNKRFCSKRCREADYVLSGHRGEKRKEALLNVLTAPDPTKLKLHDHVCHRCNLMFRTSKADYKVYPFCSTRCKRENTWASKSK